MLTDQRFVTEPIKVSFFFCSDSSCDYTLPKERKTQTTIVTIEVDLNKVYDGLEWDFIEAMLRQARFSTLWISFIMECIPHLPT